MADCQSVNQGSFPCTPAEHLKGGFRLFGVCPKCHRHTKLTKHHIYRSAVWFPYRQEKKKYLCRDCHDDLERKVTEAENKILRQYPEIYPRVLNEFLYPKKKKTRKNCASNRSIKDRTGNLLGREVCAAI